MNHSPAPIAAPLPPTTASPQPLSRAGWIWLAALLAATTLVCSANLSGGAGFEPTDCWVAQTAREMSEGGTWREKIVPRFSGETRMQKSPGPYWAVIAAAAARGAPIDEAAARLPNVFWAVVLVATIFWLTRRVAGERAAVFAGFSAASSVLILYWSHRGASDLGVAACTAASLACLWVAAADQPAGLKRSLLWIGCYFFAGLGMLYKMPMTLVTVGLPAFVYVLLTARWRMLLKPIHGLGLLAFALPWAPWAIAVLLLEPTAWDKWRVEFLDRFTGDLPNVENQRTDLGLYFLYPLAALVYCAPFSFSLFPALGKALVALRYPPRGGVNRDGVVFLLVWFLAHLAFFTASAGKEMRYFLPALPPLFVLLGVELAALFDPRRTHPPRRTRTAVAAICTLIPAGMGAGAYGLYYWWKHKGSSEGIAWDAAWPAYAIFAAIFCTGAIAAALLYLRRRPHAAFAAIVLMMWASWSYGWPALGPLLVSQAPFRDFAAQLRATLSAEQIASIRHIGAQDPRHTWYGDVRFPRIIDQLELLRLQGGRRSLDREIWLTAVEMIRRLSAAEPAFLVMTLEDYALFSVAADRVAARLGVPTPPHHIWLRTRKGREHQHYLLISNRPPDGPPPQFTISDKLRQRLEQRLRRIEAGIGDLLPAAAPRATSAPATSTAPGAGG